MMRLLGSHERQDMGFFHACLLEIRNLISNYQPPPDQVIQIPTAALLEFLEKVTEPDANITQGEFKKELGTFIRECLRRS